LIASIVLNGSGNINTVCFSFFALVFLKFLVVFVEGARVVVLPDAIFIVLTVHVAAAFGVIVVINATFVIVPDIVLIVVTAEIIAAWIVNDVWTIVAIRTGVDVWTVWRISPRAIWERNRDWDSHVVWNGDPAW